MTATATPLAYSVKTAVAATGLSETHLRDAINRGDLAARRSNRDAEGEPTGKWVILHADLAAYLEGLPDG